MRLAMIENLAVSEAYCNQRGIFPAREAVVMQQQARGVPNVSSDHVFMGNGVSELIDLTLRGLLNPGDEVLIPTPGLSALDGRDRAQRRQGGPLSVPRVARLQPRRRGDRGA